MQLRGSLWTTAIVAVVLCISLGLRALAGSEAGPLTVTSGTGTAYAIEGVSTSTSYANGIIGTAKTGYGITGITSDAKYAGVFGTSPGAGVHGQSSGPSGEGVLGVNLSGGYGIVGQSKGIGIYAQSTDNYIALQADGGNSAGEGIHATGFAGVIGDGSGSTGGSIGVLGEALGNTGSALGATTEGNGALGITSYSYSAGGYVMSLDQSGNMILKGTLTQNSTPAIVMHGNGPARVSYSAQSTSPAIEDTGEGRIANGAGYIAIDRDFASTLDSRTAYSVFVTPEGDCHGLYVTAKSPRGFMVRELMNGRSSIDFSYRIVGRPVANNAPRLPLFTDKLAAMPAPPRRHHHSR